MRRRRHAPPTDAETADARANTETPPLPCETDVPVVAGTPATDAFASARGGMPV
jgi:hypothetical protein